MVHNIGVGETLQSVPPQLCCLMLSMVRRAHSKQGQSQSTCSCKHVWASEAHSKPITNSNKKKNNVFINWPEV